MAEKTVRPELMIAEINDRMKDSEDEPGRGFGHRSSSGVSTPEP